MVVSRQLVKSLSAWAQRSRTHGAFSPVSSRFPYLLAPARMHAWVLLRGAG